MASSSYFRQSQSVRLTTVGLVEQPNDSPKQRRSRTPSTMQSYDSPASISTNDDSDEELSYEFDDMMSLDSSNDNDSLGSEATSLSGNDRGDYDDDDLQTLTRLINKLHAREIGGGRRRDCEPCSSTSQSSALMTDNQVILDLPSEVPVDPPHFTPLPTSHHLSISSVESSWTGPSFEVVLTDSVNDLLPSWKKDWTRERAEWEEKRKSLLAKDIELKRSRSERAKSVSFSTSGDKAILWRRNNSMPVHAAASTAGPLTLLRSASREVAGRNLQHASSFGSSSSTTTNRHYRYGRPPTLPRSSDPNPMVRRSSKKINKKHARYALCAGMMLGIRESVGGALGVEAELEISNWEGWERSWQDTGEEDDNMGGENDESVALVVNGSTTKDISAATIAHPVSPSSPRPANNLLTVATLTAECERVAKYKFPANQFYLGSNTSKPLSHAYKFKVYAPLIFARIRSLFGVEKQTFLHSICGKFNFYEFASNARSGQFFFYSHDGQYMIKTLTYTESKFLREILPFYYRHLTRYPSTFLTHFYGMYRVCMPDANNRQLHFVVMRSVFHTTKKISRVWDLKGSKANRKSEPGESVGKDLDILEEGRKLRFVDPCARSAFIDQIRRDATFLARLGIMDYSLLLGLHNCEEESNEDDGGNVDEIAPGVNGPSTPPGRKEEVEELSGSNTPLRRGIIQRASSVGLFKKGNTTAPPVLHRGLTDVARTSKSPFALNIIPESPPSSSVAAAMSMRKKSAITSRPDSGIEGYGGLLADGSISMNKEIYFCGIIDFLQYYNAMKKGETVVRKAQGHSGEDISCVDPETYGNRFVKFISNLIEKAE